MRGDSVKDNVHVIAAGFVTVDIIKLCSLPWFCSPQEHVYCAGGTAGNVLCHLAQLDSTREHLMVGGVGEDELASVIRDDLSFFGVNTRGLWTFPESPTKRISHYSVSVL